MIAEEITLGIVISAALADSINPCVWEFDFSPCILTRVFKSRGQMIVGGLCTFSSSMRHILLASAFLRLRSLSASQAFYWAAAIVAILAGLFEMKDYFGTVGLTLRCREAQNA